MNTIVIPLLQAAGPIALSVVSFALAFSWSARIEPAARLRTEGSRLAGFSAIGALLLLAAAIVYVTPGLLLADDFGTVVAMPLVATWAIVAGALVVRSMLQTGVVRVVSAAFAVVAVSGAAAGILTAVSRHHPIAATILPTGAFVLVVGAVAALVAWARPEAGSAAA